MATATAQVTTEETPEVKVTVKRRRWYKRFGKWARNKWSALKAWGIRTGRRIRHNLNRARNNVVRVARVAKRKAIVAGRWTSSKAKFGWRWTVRKAKWGWRFAKKNAKAAPTLARRGTGYTLRAVSYVAQVLWLAVTSTVFLVALAIAAVVWVMASGGQYYNENVHTQFQQMSQPRAGDTEVVFVEEEDVDEEQADSEESAPVVDWDAATDETGALLEVTHDEEGNELERSYASQLRGIDLDAIYNKPDPVVDSLKPKSEDELRKMELRDRFEFYSTQHAHFWGATGGNGLKMLSYWLGRLLVIQDYEKEGPTGFRWSDASRTEVMSFYTIEGRRKIVGYDENIKPAMNQFMKGVKAEYDLIKDQLTTTAKKASATKSTSSSNKKSTSSSKKSTSSRSGNKRT